MTASQEDPSFGGKSPFGEEPPLGGEPPHGGEPPYGEEPSYDEEPSPGAGPLGAALVGSVLGGLVGGLALYALVPVHLAFVGSILGVGSAGAQFGAWLGLSILLGVAFAGLAGPSIDSLGRSVGLGLTYGAVAGVAVGLVGVPAYVPGAEVPLSNPSIVVGYGAFGLLLGLGYGLARDGAIPLPSLWFVPPRVRGAVVASVAAAAVSGAVVYAAQPAYLRFLGALAGDGTPTTGLLVWLALSVGLGGVFAAVAGGHAARGNDTTGYGVVYGIVVAVFVGLLAVPAVVTEATEWTFGFEHVAAGSLAAFVVYGLVLGSTYGKTVNRRPLRPAFLVGRGRATFAASLVAGAVTAPILYGGSWGFLLLLAEVIGTGGSFVAGTVAWIGVAGLLGVGFAAFPARRVERTDLPTETGVKVGAIYGLFVGVPVAMFLVPPVVNGATSYQVPAPYTDGVVLAAFLLTGVVHGVVYGGLRGQGRLTPVFLRGRVVPVLGGTIAGGATGSAVIYAATPEVVYFRTLGSVVGSSTFGAGLAVWFAIALACGVAFVPLAARVVEYRVGVARGLGVGALYGVVLAALVGAFVVPGIVRAGGVGMALPHLAAPVAGYGVFGLVFGGVYGGIRTWTIADEEYPTTTAVGTAGQRALVFGSLFGGSVGGLVAHHMIGPVTMRYFGALVGYGGSAAVGWIVWLVLCLVLGTVFAVALGPRIDDYARSIDEFVERDEDLEAVFGDVLEQAPITTSATVTGFAYGVLVAVAVGAIAVPLLINTTTEHGIFVPLLEPYFLLAFVVYGVVMGLGYGVVKEF